MIVFSAYKANKAVRIRLRSDINLSVSALSLNLIRKNCRVTGGHATSYINIVSSYEYDYDNMTGR